MFLCFRGNLSATHVRLENAAHPVKYQGVVCSLKDGYGAIERADVVKEIFFHEQDVNCGLKLKPGDDVEFNIQMKLVGILFYSVYRQMCESFFFFLVF